MRITGDDKYLVVWRHNHSYISNSGKVHFSYPSHKSWKTAKYLLAEEGSWSQGSLPAVGAVSYRNRGRFPLHGFWAVTSSPGRKQRRCVVCWFLSIIKWPVARRRPWRARGKVCGKYSPSLPCSDNSARWVTMRTLGWIRCAVRTASSLSDERHKSKLLLSF